MWNYLVLFCSDLWVKSLHLSLVLLYSLELALIRIFCIKGMVMFFLRYFGLSSVSLPVLCYLIYHLILTTAFASSLPENHVGADNDQNSPTATAFVGAESVPENELASSEPAKTKAIKQHAIALHGEPAYPENFTHFNYVNPNAPKGGQLRQDAMGSFDSLNPYIIKGSAVAGIGQLFETLTYQSPDEAFTQYGLLAQFIERDPENHWVRFYLRPEARFHNGLSVTAQDVAFSFNILKEKGAPFYKSYYAEVTEAVVLDKLTVQFNFVSSTNKELPLIVGSLPVFSEQYWQEHDFSKADLQIPVGSGPYKIKEMDAGRSITYQLDPNYWGKELAVNKGRYNIETLIYEYYRDSSVALEAFKSGRIDYRVESSSKDWATAYEGQALSDGRFIKEEIDNKNPQGMQAFLFNTRRSKFADVNARRAFTELFDFEWTNTRLFYSAYKRSNSFFSGSELAASTLPEPDELALLNPYKSQLPAEVFTQIYQAPVTSGDGNIRPQMRRAVALLKKAGWQLKDGKMIDAKGKQLQVEFMLFQKSFERVVLPYVRNLAKVGIKSSIRVVDISQYINRLNSFDFDLIVGSFGQSASPGNEQLEYWGSDSAEKQGSRNWLGIKNPVVDALIANIVHAPDRSALVTAVKALDRVLLWGHYVIPQWHLNTWRVAYWQQLKRPATLPQFSLALDTWWIAPETTLAEQKQGAK